MTTNRDPYTARGQAVTSEGQGLVLAEVHTEARHNSEVGNVHLIGSGFVVHSDTANDFKGVFFLKNTSDYKEVHMGYLRTCNEVPGKWQYHDGVSAMSNSTQLSEMNMNRSKNKALTSTIEAGGSTSTFTGGAIYPQWIQGGPGHSIQPFEGSLILGPGDSFGLSFAPFAAASSNECCVTLQVWQVDPA